MLTGNPSGKSTEVTWADPLRLSSKPDRIPPHIHRAGKLRSTLVSGRRELRRQRNRESPAVQLCCLARDSFHGSHADSRTALCISTYQKSVECASSADERERLLPERAKSREL